MPVTETTRQERRKARTRASILEAAAQVFAATGDATVEQIADEADVAVATVYAHFTNKADVQRAITEWALAENERHMMAVYESDVPPVERLVDAAGAYIQFVRESPHLFKLVALRMNGSSVEGQESDEVLAARVDLMTQALAQSIAQGVADGSIRNVPPRGTALFLWGALNGLIALSLRPGPLRVNDTDLATAAEAGLGVLLEGLVSDLHRDADGRLDDALRDKIRTVTSLR